jgi:hypothetical protein
MNMMSDAPRSVLDDLRALELPKRSFMVMGSGILEALHIRQAEDVDMVVSDDMYDWLRASGWTERIASNGSVGIESGVFQAYNQWTDDLTIKKLPELLVDAQWVEGIPYNSLAKLALYKERRGRDKDMVDLELIKKFQRENRT